MIYDVITLGSANIDIFVRTKVKPETIKHLEHLDIAYKIGDKVLIKDLLITTGGGGTNTAVAFSRLRLKTGFIGVVGNDLYGEQILRELKKEKVHFLGKVKSGNTGLSIILPSENDRTILAFKGINDSLSIKDIHLSKIKTKWLYVSSMLGKSHETVNKIIHIVKKKGTKVAINFSRYLASKGIAHLSSMLLKADVIIMNQEEAEVLTGKKHRNDILNAIYEHTNGIVVITSGSNDIFACDGSRLYLENVVPINPVDATGAGDAFAAGFVYSIMSDPSIHHALERGHKEAVSVLRHIGAKNELLRKL